MYTEYLWIVVVGGIVGFISAYGIGANDVANAFATSVGSKAIPMWGALCIAAVFEFAGALGLGAAVTKTISGGIAKTAAFTGQPDVFMYGMLCALTAACVWVLVATYFSLPVSTTHAIVGAVVGFALVFKGSDAVFWLEATPNVLPYYKGMVPICLGWIISPVMCALVSALLFAIVRTFVLRRDNAVKMAIMTLPILVFVAVFVNLFFVLYKGVTNTHKFTPETAAWIAAVVGAGCALFVGAFIPKILKKSESGDLRIMSFGADDEEAVVAEAPAKGDISPAAPETSHGVAGVLGKIKTAALYGAKYDIHKAVELDEDTARMHAAAEQFDSRAEGLYSYAQIFTACCVSFAHGANDVANAIGPFAAIYQVYRTETVTSGSEAPRWILAMGGVGIVVGLATYGYNVMAALGVYSIKITPSRGFLIEMTTALVVAAGSAAGLPLSTTHCQVGGTWGVGLMEGNFKNGGGLNFKLALKFLLGWIGTVVVAGGLAALLFAQGAYAPTLNKN